MRTFLRLSMLTVVLLAAVLLLAPDARADGDCLDYITGVGLVPSITGTGKAAFGFAVGYGTPTSPLGGFFAATDPKVGFYMRSISIDDYVGYFCATADGFACYERTFTGMAQVRWPGFSGVRPFLVDTIDFAGHGPTTPRSDYIDFNGGGYINVSLVNQGGIAIHNASAAPGCD